MKKIMLFVLALCLCLTAVGAAFAETAVTEAPAADKPAAEMTVEELYQAGKDAYDAGDYGKTVEYFQLAADAGSTDRQKYGSGSRDACAPPAPPPD